MKLLGAALIVIGFAALIAGGIPYHKREHVAQLGDLKMEVTEKRKLEIPPVASGILILAGAVMLLGVRPRSGG